MSCPPQKGRAVSWLRMPICHLHSHSVAGAPFTMEMLTSLMLSRAGLDPPLTPHEVKDREPWPFSERFVHRRPASAHAKRTAARAALRMAMSVEEDMLQF